MADEALRKLLAGLGEDDRERLVLDLLNRARTTAPAFGQDVAKTVGVLRSRYEALCTKEEFVPGQLVKWKDGLKNKRRPAEGEPAIVLTVLSDPILDTETERSSAYFREPLDIVLGLLGEGGEFVVYHFDSRRFTAFERPTSEGS